jgi:hypothetical protein
MTAEEYLAIGDELLRSEGIDPRRSLFDEPGVTPPRL